MPYPLVGRRSPKSWIRLRYSWDPSLRRSSSRGSPGTQDVDQSDPAIIGATMCDGPTQRLAAATLDRRVAQRYGRAFVHQNGGRYDWTLVYGLEHFWVTFFPIWPPVSGEARRATFIGVLAPFTWATALEF